MNRYEGSKKARQEGHKQVQSAIVSVSRHKHKHMQVQTHANVRVSTSRHKGQEPHTLIGSNSI